MGGGGGFKIEVLKTKKKLVRVLGWGRERGGEVGEERSKIEVQEVFLHFRNFLFFSFLQNTNTNPGAES